MTKPRKKPSQRRRALLQKEIQSRCPFCPSEEVDTFEVHHLNENPDDDRFENELMVCPMCHAKITAGTISRDEVFRKKGELMNDANLQSQNPTDTSGKGIPLKIIQFSGGDNVVQAAGQNVTIKISRGRRAKAAVPTSGVVGTSPKERAYVKHLYDRLIDYKMAIPNYDAARAGRTVARYVREAFGTTWSHVPIEWFDELVHLLQTKIDETPIGRKHLKNGTKSYSSFEEFSS